MTKKFSSILLMLACSLLACIEMSAQLSSRNATNSNQQSASQYAPPSFSKGSAIQAQVRVSKASSDYGTEVSVLKEEFNNLTNGSIGNPDLNTVMTYAWPEEWEYPWTNFKPGFLGMDAWGGENVWQAGGTICLNASPQNFSHLNTPMLNVSEQGGIVFVRFKARTAEGYAHQILLEAAETYNMAPTWTILGAVPIPQVTPEWQTYEVMFYGGGSYSIFNLVVSDHPIYVDDFEVFQIDQFVDTPVALKHSNYKGQSFDANWTKVADAEDYQLDVYSINRETKNQDFLLEGQVVADTSFTVTNAVSGQTYYYQVKSRKGTHTSIVSKANEVFDLEVPKLNPVTNLNASETEVNYTASWNAVPTAERYNYFTRFKRVAEQDGVFVVTDENFDGITNADGDLTGWTVEEPSHQTYDDLYLSDLKQGGWLGKNYAPYTDYICLDAYYYINSKKDAALISPELDLSKDGGKIELSVKLYAAKDNPSNSYTRAAIALFNFDEEKGDYVQAELQYVTDEDGLVDAWKVYNRTLTKGTARSVIGIFAVYAPENLYIDDLKITQNYKKDEFLLDPFYFKRYVEGESIEVKVPEHCFGQELFHQVAAVKAAGQGLQYQGYRITPFCPLESIGKSPWPTSVEAAISLTNATVQVLNDQISINNPNNEAVMIYDLNGRMEYSNHSGASQLSVALGQRGAYIVQVGKTTVKLLY